MNEKIVIKSQHKDNQHLINYLAEMSKEAGSIDSSLFVKYDVKRGLRDVNGHGVLTGLTNISDVRAKKIVDGKEIPMEGMLSYRGYNIKDLINGFSSQNRFGFEEVAYLLLFNKLPNKIELADFSKLLYHYRRLPTNFTKETILTSPSNDMMNSLARSVLSLYSYDKNAEDTSIPNVLEQSLRLISRFPSLIVYGYQAFQHYYNNKSLIIHNPSRTKSAASNLLKMLRVDGKYTHLEAKVLDILLMLHMEHGGGNNSSFTTRVVTSTLTDTYSAIAAAIGSLKGPRHGGANVKVVHMFDDMKVKIKDWKDEDEINNYLNSTLDKKEYDKAGLIYGVGHAVYSISDPRAVLLKDFVRKLSKEKGRTEEFELYSKIEQLAPKAIAEKRRMYKGISVNVDFYSGFVYRMLELPEELFTPLFAVARIVGWSAHRMEELSINSKIIRPAYMPLSVDREYIPLDKRK